MKHETPPAISLFPMHPTRWQLLAIVAIFVSLGLLYSAVVPPLEAPDAYYHFAVIEHISRTGQAPPKENPNTYPWQQMTFHAPLYYRLSAALISPIDTSDFSSSLPRNPHAQIGEPKAADNQNFVAHAAPKTQGASLAVYVVRGFSLALGVLTVLSVYTLVRYALPATPQAAPLASLILALIPQFIFMHSVVSNDSLVIALSTLALALLVRMLRRGATWRNLLVLAVLLALNSISKASGMSLYPVVALAMLYMGWRDGWPWRRFLLYWVIGLGAWLLIAGWWYYGNWVDFGDPTATSEIAAATGSRREAVDAVGELRGLYYSFVGLFGWFNVIAPTAFYTYMAVAGGLALLGWWWVGRKGWQRDDVVILALLLVYVGVVMAAWWQFNTLVEAAQGRLWFPAIGVLALFLGRGLAAWPWSTVPILLLVGTWAWALALALLLIAPTYRPMSQESAKAWQPPEGSVRATFSEPWSDEDCLNLYATPPHWDQEKERLHLNFITQTDCPLTGYWSIFLHITDPSLESCQAGVTEYIRWQYDTMPDGGNLPLPAFKVGHIQRHQFSLDISSLSGSDPKSLEFQMGFYDASGSFIRMPVTSIAPNDGLIMGRCGTDTLVWQLWR